jgi:uncharacterized protein (DUF1778 family)
MEARAQSTLNARLPLETKRLLQSAARLRGQSLSDFVLGAAYDQAVSTLRAYEILELSRRDSALFATAIAMPATPLSEVTERFVAAHIRANVLRRTSIPD